MNLMRLKLVVLGAFGFCALALESLASGQISVDQIPSPDVKPSQAPAGDLRDEEEIETVPRIILQKPPISEAEYSNLPVSISPVARCRIKQLPQAADVYYYTYAPSDSRRFLEKRSRQRGEYRVYYVGLNQYRFRVTHGGKEWYAEGYVQPGESKMLEFSRDFKPHPPKSTNHNTAHTDPPKPVDTAKLEKNIVTLSGSVENLSSSLNNVSSAINDAPSKIAKAVEKANVKVVIDKTLKSYGDALKRLVAKQKDLATAKARLPRLRVGATQAEAKLRRADIDLAAFVNSAKPIFKAQEDATEKAVKQRDLANKLEHEALHLENQAKSNSNLKTEAKVARQAAENAKNAARDRDEELAKAKKTADLHRQAIANAQSSFNVAKAAADKAASDERDGKAHVALLEKEIVGLERDANYLEGIQVATKVANDKNALKSKALNRLAKANHSSKEANAGLVTAQSRHDSTKEQLNQANASKNDFQAAIAAMKSALAAENKLSDEWKLKLNDLKQQSAQNATLINQVQHKINVAAATIGLLKTNIRNSELSIKSLEALALSLDRQLKTAANELSHATTAKNNADKELKNAKYAARNFTN